MITHAPLWPKAFTMTKGGVSPKTYPLVPKRAAETARRPPRPMLGGGGETVSPPRAV